MKRFRDREIWQRPWYRRLGSTGREMWNYITDWCDNVGVWIPDKETMEYYLGETVDLDGFPGLCNGNITVLPNGKWWIVDFCDFQYGELSENCKPHSSYIALLRSHGLLELYTENHENKGYPKGIHTLQDKEKEKDIEKEKDSIIIKKKFVKPSKEEVSAYCAERGNSVSPGRFIDYYESKGWLVGKSPMRDWKAAVRNWEGNDFKGGGHGPELRPDEIIIPDFSRGGRKKSTYQS